jgi:hypothetical protein
MTGSDLMVLAAQASELSLNTPLVQKILASLDLLLIWVRIHENVLERYESKRYFGFQNFALNANYARAFNALLGLII